MSSVVYWIRHEDHTDMFTQGYIGVSSQLDKRLKDHEKKTENTHLKNAITMYGWENLVKQVILIAEEVYCLMIESKLRAEDKIGWNIVKGGGKPPSSLGKKFTRSQEYKDKQRLAKLGKRHKPEVEEIIVNHLIKNGMATRFKTGSKAHDVNVTCPYCDKTGLRAPMHRWHMDKCKFKENHFE